jgi:hypothetical protein
MGSITDGAPRHAADVAHDPGLVEPRINDADARRADPDANRAYVAYCARLIQTWISDADTRCAYSGTGRMIAYRAGLVEAAVACPGRAREGGDQDTREQGQHQTGLSGFHRLLLHDGV